MNPFVVDASVALGWFLDDESDTYATETLRKLETESAIVPALWAAEIANALTVAERRSRISEAETAGIVSFIHSLPIQVDETPVLDSIDRLIALARRHAITAYDATYMELALRLNAPLATLDRSLREAAERSGVSPL